MDRKGWYVSYNPDISFIEKNYPMGFVNTFPVELFKEGKVSNIETALVADGEFYILNGDWRKEYEKISSKKKALEFFRSKREFINPWSTNE